MASHMTFAELESSLEPDPEFYVEPIPAPGPDPKMWPEIQRQAAFIAYLRKTSPKIIARAIPNEGKRGFKEQHRIRKSGVVAGTFDTLIVWDTADSTIPDCALSMAMCEFKGFDARGRAGKLSVQQIEFGNSLHQRGHAVACFYTATAALNWLASLGAPIKGKIRV